MANRTVSLTPWPLGLIFNRLGSRGAPDHDARRRDAREPLPPDRLALATAGATAEGMPPPRRKWVDAWVKRAAKFLTTRCDHRPRRAQTNTAIADAHRLRHATDPRLRDEIETRVLAGQDPVDIADRCNLAAEVVEAYEQLFFDLRERLGARDYILSVVDPNVTLTFGTPSQDTVVKILAYRFGVTAVDILVGYLPGMIKERATGRRSSNAEPGLEGTIRRAVLALALSADEAIALGPERIGLIAELLGQGAATKLASAVSTAVTIGELPDWLVGKPVSTSIESPVQFAGPAFDPTILAWPTIDPRGLFDSIGHGRNWAAVG
jgi:hypothetical protein